MPTVAGTALSTASFLAFGALLVLYGANSSELLAAFEIDYAELGLVGSMLSLGLGAGIVVAGPTVDRFPRKPLYVLACLLVLASAATLGPGSDYRALLIHTLAIGFGAGFYETVLNAMIVEQFRERSPRRLVFIHAAATAAASATPLFFELARTITTLAWYDTFRIVGLAHGALILAAVFVPMRRAGDTQSSTAKVEASTPASSQDRAALAAVCLATFAYVGVESALSLFVVDHAISSLELEAVRAARTISAFWGGLLIGRLAVGFASRSAGAGTTASLAAVAALVLLGFGAGWIGPPELAMALVGFFLGGVFPVMIGLAGIALPSSPGTAVGLAGGLGSLGGFVVPWVSGHVANQAGLPTALSSLSLWLLLLVAAAGFASTRRRT